MQYDLFISYARKDNVLTVDGKPGYITSFIEGLKREHRRFGGENLKIFFDKDDIRNGDDWEIKIDALSDKKKLSKLNKFSEWGEIE